MSASGSTFEAVLRGDVDVPAGALGRWRCGRASPVGSTPSTTFSATVNTGTSMKCWCTMPMPGVDGVAGSEDIELTDCVPSIRMSPSSACMTGHRGCSSTCSCPRRFRRASPTIEPGSTIEVHVVVGDDTPGKRLVMPRSSSIGSSQLMSAPYRRKSISAGSPVSNRLPRTCIDEVRFVTTRR